MTSSASRLDIGPPVPNLARWGLSADADLIYRMLVHHGAQPEDRLNRELGLGGRRTTAALDELSARRLARFDGRWCAVSTERALGILRSRRFPADDPWASAQKMLSVFHDLALPATDADLPYAIRRFPKNQVHQRIRVLVEAERHEHLTMQTERVFTEEALERARPLDQKLVDRGVRVRVLGRPRPDGDASAALSQAMAGQGGDYRETEDIPLQLMVFDRHTALVPAGPEPGAAVLEITAKPVVDALVLMFTRRWYAASDPLRKGIPPVMLTPREKAIVSGLAQGLSDEQVAAQLNISVRTIAYALRDLMDQLQVDTRFQLGLVLGATASAPLPNRPEPAEQEESETRE
jgi:DNA-binding CsgD family transcriptional regulator